MTQCKQLKKIISEELKELGITINSDFCQLLDEEIIIPDKLAINPRYTPNGICQCFYKGKPKQFGKQKQEESSLLDISPPQTSFLKLTCLLTLANEISKKLTADNRKKLKKRMTPENQRMQENKNSQILKKRSRIFQSKKESQ